MLSKYINFYLSDENSLKIVMGIYLGERGIKHPEVKIGSKVAGILVKFCVVKAPLFHEYVNGAVPPVTVRLIEPVLAPLHTTFTWVSLKDKVDTQVLNVPDAPLNPYIL